MIYAYWIRGAEFAELAALSMASVLRIDPKAKIHVVTDDGNTPFPSGTHVKHVLPPGRAAMVANLDAQLLVLNYLQRGERVLFLDADTILRRPFPWSNAVDMAVTWRAEVNGDREAALIQPYNYGVVAANVNAQTREAFLWIRSRILNMSRKNQDWYGNQLALAELIGAAPKEGSTDKEVRIRWAPNDLGTALRVRQLPCAVWNYSPDSADEVISDKGILHMKGGRKDLMRHFSEAA